MGLAGLFQKYSGADRLLDAAAAKHHAVIAQEHGEVLPERKRNSFAFALQRDQRHVGLVPWHVDELIGVERKRLQRLGRRRENAGVKRMGVDNDIDVGARAKNLRMDRPLGMAAAAAGDLLTVPIDQHEIVRAQNLAETDLV